MSKYRAHTGEAHRRFVIVATLLSLIDPIRGEPTVHSLDRHPHDGEGKEEHLRKKFLDSFALTSSTSRRGGETAAAVCLEQGHPSGNVLRLARNLETPEDVIDRLQAILDLLTEVASGEVSAKQKETEILGRVIDLTVDKIRDLMKKVHNSGIHELMEQAYQNIESSDTFLDETERNKFRRWVGNLPVLASLDPCTESALLIPHIEWASQARWVHSEAIEAAFFPDGQEFPSWVSNIYKLGRYYVAAKVMLKIATKQPSLFTGIHVEVIENPEPQRFSLMQDTTALMTVLKRLTKADPKELLSRLGQTWLTEDPEARFRQACRLVLTVHAEMQLLSFYDHHPELTPRLLFMGTSKKACFLCHKFMSRHPLEMSVSASHQKLYPSWMPAPCWASAVRKDHKAMLWELSRHLESTAVRDLETRLGIYRPKSLDSTAGPSLPTTDSVTSGWWAEDG